MDSKVDLAKSYAMYSEEYAPDENNRLDQTKIKLIYEKETLKITKRQHIWVYGNFSHLQLY